MSSRTGKRAQHAPFATTFPSGQVTRRISPAARTIIRFRAIQPSKDVDIPVAAEVKARITARDLKGIVHDVEGTRSLLDSKTWSLKERGHAWQAFMS
jgi:hypothetical protein